MKKTMFKFAAFVLCALFTFKSKAQLSGVLTVPGTYTSIGAAIADLNLQGVNGAVTVNVSAGFTETAPVGGFTLTATGTSVNPITFQKNGIGANPLITAYVGGTGTPGTLFQDGVWRLVGSDYITIDGIDIVDPNITNPATMEFGYGLLKASAGDGCQYNTIKNCVITLNRINNATGTAPATDGSRGIDVVNALSTAHNAVVTVTASSGTNSYNMFYGNTIQNCNIGIAIIGFAAATPFTNADSFNDVGGMSAVTGNTIINYGGGAVTNPAAAVRTLAQYNINVSYNTINNNNGAGVNHATTLRGIYLNTATSANASITNNTVTVNSGATTSQLVAIENVSGSTPATNTINIVNNSISNCTYSTTTSGAFFGIYNNAATPAYLNINNNTISGLTLNSIGSTGAVNLLYVSGTIGSALSITSNTIQSITGLNTSGTIYNIYCSNSTNNYTVQNNFVNNISRAPGLAGTMYGFYNFGSPTGGSSLINNNIFNNMVGGTGASTYYGIYQGTSTTQTLAVSNNTISNIGNGTSPTYGIYFSYGAVGSLLNNNLISNITAGGTVYGLNIGAGSAPLGLSAYSNTINTLSSNGAFSVFGIHHAAGTNSNIYKNKIYDLQCNNAAGTVFGLNIAALTIAINVQNNYIGDLRAPLTSNPVNAVVGINITAATANANINIFYNTVYMNATSSGANFGTTGLLHTSNATATTAQLFLRNNIIINTSTPSGTGIVAAYRRSTAALNNFNTASNNNNFYAGVPSVNTLIYYDGTNSHQTLAPYQTFVTPRDANSITESTTFLSTVGTSTNYLHVDPSSPSLTESGAINIVGITDDYDNDIRQGNPGYTGSGIAPDMGADEYNQILAACSTVTGGTQTTTTYTRCAGQTVSLNTTSITTGSGITYQWQVSTTPSGPYSNVVGGSGANTAAYTSAILTAGTFYYVLLTTCTISSATATSNESTVTVNPVPTATATSNSPLCSGQTLNLTGGTDVGTNFTWVGPASFTVQNPSISATAGLSGTYTLIVSTANCTTTPVSVTVTITTTPSNLTVTPTSGSLCVGGSQTITAVGGDVDKTFGFGTQANQNTASTSSAGYPAPYSAYYGGQRMQMLVLASELSASGFVANSPIMSVQFPVVSKGANWGTTIMDLKNYQVNIGSTAITNLTTYQTGLTNVVAPMNFTPSVGYNNLHTFSSPFIWDGTSNIIIETTWSNNTTNGTADLVVQYNSPTTFTSCVVSRADATSATAMATITAINFTYSARPDFKLNGMGTGSYAWTPASSLSSSTSATTVATPTTNTNYTLNVMNGTCSSTAVVSLTVSPLPSVTVAATPTVICIGNSSTLTASGATTYSWTPAIPMSGVVSPSVSSTYTVTGSDACGNDTQTITVNVTATPTVSAVTSASILCSGNSASLTASGALTYSWTGVGAGSSVVVSPTITTTYTVEGIDANGCIDTTTFVQVVSPCTGIDNVLANSYGINIYPNPNNGIIILVISDLTKTMELEIFDAVGKRVLTEHVSTIQSNINLSELANGIYSYRISSANGYIKNGKLIKE